MQFFILAWHPHVLAYPQSPRAVGASHDLCINANGEDLLTFTMYGYGSVFKNSGTLLRVIIIIISFVFSS